MNHKYLNNLRLSNLSINNKTLRIDVPCVIYQISNIAYVDKRIKIPGPNDPIYKAYVAAFTFGICMIILTAAMFLIVGQPLGLIVLILVIPVTSSSFQGIKELIQQKDYGILISTNDARTIIIYDKNERFIDDIISKLYEVMENQNTPISYHCKIEGDVIQQNGHFDIGVNRGRIN
jgi:hypothetical protein